jgi:hypothetical protein
VADLEEARAKSQVSLIVEVQVEMVAELVVMVDLLVALIKVLLQDGLNMEILGVAVAADPRG